MLLSPGRLAVFHLAGVIGGSRESSRWEMSTHLWSKGKGKLTNSTFAGTSISGKEIVGVRGAGWESLESVRMDSDFMLGLGPSVSEIHGFLKPEWTR